MPISPSIKFLENRAIFKRIEATFNYHSARVSCWTECGVTHADYTGVLSASASIYLGQNLQRIAGLTPTFESMHKAVTSPNLTEPCLKHLMGARPGCFIVRPDQYRMMTELSRLLATKGVTRLTFLESQIDHAHHWARQFH